MKKIFSLLIVLIVLAVFVGTAMFLYNKSQESPVIFSSTKPFYTNIVKKTIATGSIIPRKEINLKSQVSGIVEKVMVEAGQTIKVGDVIAEIRIIPNLVSLNNAETQLKRADISFQEIK